ncbi:hypothetical protein B484DRAFT_426262, partial [Ochromonadaceae sp. CCMP2298]
MAIVDALKEFLDSLDTGGRRTRDEQRAVRILLAIATETGLPKAAVQRRLGVTWNKSFASASLAGDAAASSNSGLSELLAGPVRKTRCDQVPPLRTLSLPPPSCSPLSTLYHPSPLLLLCFCLCCLHTTHCRYDKVDLTYPMEFWHENCRVDTF